MDYRFDGRVVAVTGAGQGLGTAYAKACAALGATVIVNDLGAMADEVARSIEAGGGRAVAVRGDVADPATSQAIVAAALDRHGRIDAVINNAGIGLNRAFAETSVEDFRRVMEINYFGTLHLVRAAWAPMAAVRYGRIVNVVSTSLYGFEGWSAYTASKGAVFGLTRTLALEAAPLGIFINMLAPAAATPMMVNNGIDAATQKAMMEMLPPEKVAPTATFLAHEACTTVGRTYLSAGGRIAPMALAEAPGMVLAAPDLARVAEAAAGEAFAVGWRAYGSIAETRQAAG